MKVGIIGAGAWGTALAIAAARGGNSVFLWSAEEKIAIEINQKRRNSYLPGVIISREIVATTKLSDISEMDVWLVATPTQFFKDIVQKSRPFWQKQPIIICAKGVEPRAGKLLSDVLSDEIVNVGRWVGVLSGPQFAGEVARGKPTGSTIAGPRKVREIARRALADFIMEDTSDIIGVQICGAGKNAVALLLGYLDGQGAGENERALEFTRAWQEIIRFGRHFAKISCDNRQSKIETFNMLCGLGDLFLTATSRSSRNYSAGFAIARRGHPGGTIEGISALKWIVKTARRNNLSLPVLEAFAKKVKC